MRPRTTIAAVAAVALLGAGMAYGGHPVLRPEGNRLPKPPSEQSMDRRTRKRLAAKRKAFLANDRGRQANAEGAARRSARNLDPERYSAIEKLTNWQRSQWQNETLGTDDPRDYVTLQHWKRRAA